MTRRSAALLVVLAATWGGVYPLTTIALRDFPPAWVVLGRAVFAAMVLVPAAIYAGGFGPLRSRWGRLLVAGTVQAAIPLGLLTVGQQHVSAGVAGILSATQPLFVVTLVMTLDRIIRLRELLGVVVGLVGVTLLFLDEVGSSATTIAGGVAVLASALFFATGSVYIHRVLPDTSPVGIAAAAMCLTALVVAPVAAVGPYPSAPGVAEWTSLVALGVIGNGLALGLFYALIHWSGPTRAALAWYLAPGFAVLYDIPLAGLPALAAVAGLILIVAGSAITATARHEAEMPPGRSKRQLTG
ncbi:MAG: DMT family transporter [Micromonosporaceae bacterium]